MFLRAISNATFREQLYLGETEMAPRDFYAISALSPLLAHGARRRDVLLVLASLFSCGHEEAMAGARVPIADAQLQPLHERSSD